MNITCENCGLQYFAGYSDALCPQGCEDRCPSCEGWLNFSQCRNPVCTEYVREPTWRKTMTLTRKIIKVDGTEIVLPGPVSTTEIRKLIGADTLDSVVMPDRIHVMLLDDAGRQRDLPPNGKATQLYWARCGRPVDHIIVGDVVIAPDSDFGS